MGTRKRRGSTGPGGCDSGGVGARRSGGVAGYRGKKRVVARKGSIWWAGESRPYGMLGAGECQSRHGGCLYGAWAPRIGLMLGWDMWGRGGCRRDRAGYS